MDYLVAGLSASHCIQAALQAANKANGIGTILDFPCGYGRVLRFLEVMFPDCEITGGEKKSAALDFCQRAFSVTPFLSDTEFNNLSLPRKFDLIWCGSLITHINEQSTVALLRFFYRHLFDGGICVFTTHGQRPLEHIRDEIRTYNLSERGQEDLLNEFQEHGYGYADYSNQSGYGVSVVCRSRVLELAKAAGAWEVVLYLDHGWHDL